MKTQSPDTHPKIERIQIEAYRRMTPAEKLRIAFDMTEAMARLAMANVRARHPQAQEQECRLRLASRWLDADLMRKAYGWNPREEGY